MLTSDIKNSSFKLPDDISEREFHILGVFAVLSKECDTSDVARALGWKNSDVNLSELKDKGYLRQNTFYYWNTYCALEPIYFLTIAINILASKPALKEKIEKNSYNIHPRAIALWELATSIYNDNKNIEKVILNIISQFSESFISQLFVYHRYDKFVRKALIAMNIPLYHACYHSHYNNCIRAFADWGPYSTEAEKGLLEDYEKKNKCNLSKIAEHIKANQFLLTGVKPQFDSPCEYSLAIDAILKMYSGNYDFALSLFKDALKYHNADYSDKNFFFIPQYTFFLELCYTLIDSSETRKRTQILLNKKTITESPTYGYTVVAAKFLHLQNTEEDLAKNIWMFRNENDLSVSILYHNLILYRLGESDIRRNYFPSDINKLEPKEALLRYELSAYHKISDSKDLAVLLNGKPLLPRIKVKTQWEIAIEDMMALIPKTSTEDPEIDKRLVYIISKEKGDKLEVREQKKRTSGEWNKGTLISMTSFASQECKSMNEEDRILAKCCTQGSHSPELSISNLVINMIDSDRVFYDDGNDYKQITIREEKAFITVKKNQNGGFEASTNIPGNLSTVGSFRIIRRSTTEYIVYRLSKREIDILKNLEKLKTLPKESEKNLRELLERMTSCIEIHSTLIKEGTPDEYVGDTTISILITPRKDYYTITVIAVPLPEGKIQFIPGKGNAVYYDSVADKRYEIHRKIEAEKTNFQKLVDFIYGSLEYTEELDEENQWIVHPADMLEILAFAKENEKTFHIKWPEGQSVKIRSKITTSSVKASIKHKESWFEMEGNVALDKEHQITLKHLLTLFRESGGNKFVKISDDEYLILEDSLKKQLRQLEDISSGTQKIPVYQIGAIAELATGDNPLLKTDHRFKELEEKMEKASKLQPKIPEMLNAELRDYQIEGFEWMARLAAWGAGACLADDMGLGKTIQTIALMLYRKGPSLIVAPASVILNWASELQRFAPTINITILNESGDRNSAITDAGENDAVLCSYGILQREQEIISSKKWDLICLDEAHTIKNHGTKTSMAAMTLQSECRIALTGTPIQNNLAELWNIFQFLNPGILGSYDSFVKRFGTGAEIKGSGRRLKALIQPFILRRRKADVIEELPDKTEMQRMVELSKEETIVYEALRESASQSLESSNKVDVNVLSQITRLREAACSIKLIDEKWKGASSKETSAVELISQITEAGNRVLVFSQFTRFLTSVRESFTSQYSDVETLYLDGSTPIRKREEMVQQFQHGKGSVFFISLKAGGLGLNLTGANYVIHLDPWWNPAIEAQATDRTHRIGQKQNVTVYHLLTSHTVEEKILRLHKTKKDMADYLMEGTDVSRSITLDDLRNLVNDN